MDRITPEGRYAAIASGSCQGEACLLDVVNAEGQLVCVERSYAYGFEFVWRRTQRASHRDAVRVLCT